MKHRVTYFIQVQKRGFLGITRSVTKKCTVWVDGKTYRKIKAQHRQDMFSPFTLDELMMYDNIFDD